MDLASKLLKVIIYELCNVHVLNFKSGLYIIVLRSDKRACLLSNKLTKQSGSAQSGTYVLKLVKLDVGI